MARNFYMTPTVPVTPAQTVRLGTGAGDVYTETEVGKFTVLSAESRHVLAAVGADVDGQISSIEAGTSGGYSVGGIQRGVPGDLKTVLFDGLQATPGTGVIAIGDIVVVGTIVAKGTAQASWPRVCKATTAANVVQKWRVVSLGTAGTGAVSTTGVIERI